MTDELRVVSGPVLLATRNAGKLRELQPLLRALGLQAETLVDAGIPEHAEEDGLEVHDSFGGNARAKAQYFHARSGGRLVLAEDSGLCVAALDGAPGVHSKRWGAATGLSGAALDEANVDRLLDVMTGVADRSAWYACAACVVWPGGELIGAGESAGRILSSRCGREGFGYDPVFWSTELDACFGALPASRKASVSHRTRAVMAVWSSYLAARR